MKSSFSPLTTHQLTTHYSPPTTHHPLLTTHYSPLTPKHNCRLQHQHAPNAQQAGHGHDHDHGHAGEHQHLPGHEEGQLVGHFGEGAEDGGQTDAHGVAEQAH